MIDFYFQCEATEEYKNILRTNLDKILNYGIKQCYGSEYDPAKIIQDVNNCNYEHQFLIYAPIANTNLFLCQICIKESICNICNSIHCFGECETYDDTLSFFDKAVLSDFFILSECEIINYPDDITKWAVDSLREFPNIDNSTLSKLFVNDFTKLAYNQIISL